MDVDTLWPDLIPILFVLDVVSAAKCRTRVLVIHSALTKFCNSLTSDQRSQFSTPLYKLKKEKCEARKKTVITYEGQLRFTQSLPCGPGLCVSNRAVDGQGTLQSPIYSESAEKKVKKVEKDKGSTSKAKELSKKAVKPADKPTKSSADSKIAELDQKWSDWFNWLEALLMGRTLDKKPTFQTVKVALTHSPPAGVVRSSNPFIKPPTDLPFNLHQPRVSDSSSTDSHVLHRQSISQVATEHTRKDSLDSYAESDQLDRPPVGLFVEVGELSN